MTRPIYRPGTIRLGWAAVAPCRAALALTVALASVASAQRVDPVREALARKDRDMRRKLDAVLDRVRDLVAERERAERAKPAPDPTRLKECQADRQLVARRRVPDWVFVPANRAVVEPMIDLEDEWAAALDEARAGFAGREEFEAAAQAAQEAARYRERARATRAAVGADPPGRPAPRKVMDILPLLASAAPVAAVEARRDEVAPKQAGRPRAAPKPELPKQFAPISGPVEPATWTAAPDTEAVAGTLLCVGVLALPVVLLALAVFLAAYLGGRPASEAAWDVTSGVATALGVVAVVAFGLLGGAVMAGGSCRPRGPVKACHWCGGLVDGGNVFVTNCQHCGRAIF